LNLSSVVKNDGGGTQGLGSSGTSSINSPHSHSLVHLFKC